MHCYKERTYNLDERRQLDNHCQFIMIQFSLSLVQERVANTGTETVSYYLTEYANGDVKVTDEVETNPEYNVDTFCEVKVTEPLIMVGDVKEDIYKAIKKEALRLGIIFNNYSYCSFRNQNYGKTNK